MISRWEKGIIYVGYDFVLEDLLVGVNPGSAYVVNNRHLMKNAKDSSVYG